MICIIGYVYWSIFVDAQDAINFCLNAIHQAYHEGSELYVDANTCDHGHRVNFIIMEVVKFITDPEADEDPRVETFDIFNHHRTYNQMVQDFYVAQDGVQKIADLFN